jgi:hypothetical protein
MTHFFASTIILIAIVFFFVISFAATLFWISVISRERFAAGY